MSRPALKVEVAFGTNPNDTAAVNAMTAGSWTDITGWVRAIGSLDRSKRSVELDRFEAGTGKILLDNVDGRFSPTNTTSPYVGSLVPYRMIRLTATWSSVAYPLWQGYVERWPTRWADPAQGLAEIECVDILAIASQIGMTSIYTAEVLKDAPTHYYPLGDDSAATEASNQSTLPQEMATLIHNGVATDGNESFAFGSQLPIQGADNQSGLQLTRSTDGLQPGYLLRLPFANLSWAAWTLETWAMLPGGADVGHTSNNYILYMTDTQSALGSVGLQCSTYFGGWQLFVVTPDGATTNSSGTAPIIADAKPHHHVLVWSSPTLKYYVDGALVSTLTLTGSTFTGVRSCMVQAGGHDSSGASVPVKTSDAGGLSMTGTLGHVAVYNSALTSTRIVQHYTIGSVALANQLPGQRGASLLRYVNFPSWVTYNGSTVLQAAVDIAGRSLLDCLQDLADTENSELFALPDGRLCLTYRGLRIGQTTPAAVFGSNVADGEIPYQLESLRLDFDPTLVYNDVSVERKKGSSARVYDANSIRAYFTRSISRNSYAANEQDVFDAANWLLDRYAQPTLRAETIVIEAGSLGSDVTNLWPALLGLDLGDRVRLNHRPMNQPQIVLDGYIDQLAYDVDPDAGTWRVTIQISPAIRDYWLLADTAGGVHTWDAFSVLGSTTRLSY